jgi:hypothetical protein
MSEDQSTPVLLILINVFITLCFLALASFANHCLLQRDDKTRKTALHKKILSRSFNSGHRGGHANLPLGIFKIVKKSSTLSMNRFVEQQQQPSQPTPVGSSTAAIHNTSHGVSSVTNSTALSQSPPPSPIAMNANTPLLRTNGRSYSGIVPTAGRGTRSSSFVGGGGVNTACGSEPPLSNSNFVVAGQMGSDESNGARQSPPLSYTGAPVTRPPHMPTDGGVVSGPNEDLYAGRRTFHFVPTDSEESSDDDRNEVDNSSLVDPFPRVASSFLAVGSDSFGRRIQGAHGGDRMQQLMLRATSCGVIFKSRTKMFSDERSFFFIAVILCCIIEAITMLIFTFADVSTAAVNEESRGTQDVISGPQACSLFIVFAVLLHTLHAIVENLLGSSNGMKRIAIITAVIVAAYAVAIGLTIGGISEKACEYVSSSLEIILSLVFMWTGRVLPARIRTFGESTEQTAVKVRRICAIASVSLLVRFGVFFPMLQDRYGSLGAFAASLFNVVDMIPLAVSLWFLHSRQT